MEVPRYCPARALPPYSYVPGLAPHPSSDVRGHSFGHVEATAKPLDESSYSGNAAYLYAIDLFNHGFYWEAHEAWEALWHAAGRAGATADFLKGLIKLAAAGVKAREGRAAGVRQHAERAGELFRGAAGRAEVLFGLRVGDLVVGAADAAKHADQLIGDGSPNAGRALPAVLRLE
jgi:uncharacterized protein